VEGTVREVKRIHLIAPLSEGTSLQECSGITCTVEEFQFFLPPMRIHKWNEPYLPLPSWLKLVLIYQPCSNGDHNE